MEPIRRSLIWLVVLIEQRNVIVGFRLGKMLCQDESIRGSHVRDAALEFIFACYRACGTFVDGRIVALPAIVTAVEAVRVVDASHLDAKHDEGVIARVALLIEQLAAMQIAGHAGFVHVTGVPSVAVGLAVADAQLVGAVPN